MDLDVRWKQRFSNFEKAFHLLREATQLERALTALETEGVIQRFEYSVELAWETMKDFLEYSGIEIVPITPRQAIKEAFAAGIVPSGEVWIQMLEHRNALSHTYDIAVFEEAVVAIRTQSVQAMQILRDFLAQRR